MARPLRQIPIAFSILLLNHSVFFASAAAPSTRRVSPFDRLPNQDGGPVWTVDSINASIPDDTVPIAIDSKKPVPAIHDSSAALKAALLRLAATDQSEYSVAYRITGATARQTNAVEAIKLLATLEYNGIGTVRDARAAVRTSLPLLRIGDTDACDFIVRHEPQTFVGAATPVSSIKKLASTTRPSAIRLTAVIAKVDGSKVTLRSDGELSAVLNSPVDDAQADRLMNVAGRYDDGVLTVLVADVPKPSIHFDWEIIRQPAVGGTWQVHGIRVAVKNNGAQLVKSVKFRVRCFMNSGQVNDQTQSVQVGALAPGQTGQVIANFEMYNFQYIDKLAFPKAEVGLDGIQW